MRLGARVLVAVLVLSGVLVVRLAGPATAVVVPTIETVAGGVQPAGPARSIAPVGSGWPGVRVSAAGLLLSGNGVVRRVDPVTGQQGVIAGTGNQGYGGDSGPAVNATLDATSAVDDGHGNVLIADRGNNRVRMVDSSGMISTIAGTGVASFGGDTGQATSATLSSPSCVAIASDGSVLISDTENHRIRRVDPKGVITTVAGNGQGDISGDGGSALLAGIGSPRGVVAEGDGSILLTDGLYVRKIDPAGVISTVAGNGSGGSSGDGGQALNAGMTPTDVAIDPTGALLVADSQTSPSMTKSLVRRIGLDGVVTTVAGGGSGYYEPDGVPATSTVLNYVGSVAVSPTNELFIGTSTRVRTVVGGMISTLAGGEALAVQATSGSGGPASGALLSAWVNGPWGTTPQVGNTVAVAPTGEVYLSDLWTLRRIAVDGQLDTLTAAVGDFLAPVDGQPAIKSAIAVGGVAANATGEVFVFDMWRVALLRIDPFGIVHTLSVLGPPESGNPPASWSNTPIALDTSGDVIVGYGPHLYRIDAATGQKTTFAGNGTAGSSGDGGPATLAGIGLPWDLARDSSGRIYFTDVYNRVVRMIDSGGIISTVPTPPGGSTWVGIALSPTGDTYLTRDNEVVQLIADGSVEVIAGDGTSMNDGGAAANAQLVNPAALTFDGNGDLLVDDFGSCNPGCTRWTDFTGQARLRRIRFGAQQAPSVPSQVHARRTAPDAAAVWWSVPGDAGGSAITGYVATTNPGGLTCTSNRVPSCELSGLDPSISYTFTVTASNAIGTGAASDPSNPLDAAGSFFHPTATPTRLLDSRTALGGWGSAPLGPGAVQSLSLSPYVPPTATAITLNVTVTNPTAGSFLTVYPTGQPPPNASSINFGPGETIANVVVVAIGSGQSIDFFNTLGSVNVVADMAGYYDPTPLGSVFHPIAPTRVLDSRTTQGGWNSTPLTSTAARPLAVPIGGVWAGAVGWVLNITVTNASAGSFVTVYPQQVSKPNASNINFGPGQTIANQVIVPTGSIQFATAVGAVDVVVDVAGYFDFNLPGDVFHPLPPTRSLDSRTSTGGWPGPLAAGPASEQTLALAGISPVPGTASAVDYNLTVTASSSGSFLTAFPDGWPLPNSSNINFAPFETIANHNLTILGATGGITFDNAIGTVHVIVDSDGYFDTT